MCTDIHPHPGPEQTEHRGITICNFNAHSIKVTERFDYTKTVLSKAFDIITVTETWLKPTIPNSEYAIPMFNGPFRLDRPDGRAGGVMAWVKNSIITKRRSDLELGNDIELLWLELRTSSKKSWLGSVTDNQQGTFPKTSGPTSK